MNNNITGLCGRHCSRCLNYLSFCNCANNHNCKIKDCCSKLLQDNCISCPYFSDCSLISDISTEPLNLVDSLLFINRVFSLDELQDRQSAVLDHFYVQRDEENLFTKFIHYPRASFFISLNGSLGSGKTTFLYHYFSHNQSSDGIIIDIKNHSTDNYSRSVSLPESEIFFSNCIKTEVVNKIYSHYIENNLSSESMSLISSFTNDEIVHRIKLSLFHYVIQLPNQEASGFKLALNNSLSKFGCSFDTLPYSEINQLYFSSMYVVDLLLVLSHYFADNNIFVICFDNVEDIGFSYTIPWLSEYLYHIVRSYNHIYRNFSSIQHMHKLLSVVISVRYENMHKVFNTHANNGNLFTSDIVTMDYRPRFSKNIIFNSISPLLSFKYTETFFTDVLKKRIDYISSVFSTEQLAQKDVVSSLLVFNRFLQIPSFILVSRLDIVSLCNYSVKLYLLTVTKVAISFSTFTSNLRSEHLIDQSIESHLWLTQWKFDDNTGFISFSTDLYKSLNGIGKCSLSRVILTVLRNLQPASTTFGELCALIKRTYPDIDSRDISSSLYILSRTGNYNSNLISVFHNSAPIENPDLPSLTLNNVLFSDEDEIIIEPRGLITVEKYLISIDYFLLAFEFNDKMPKPLFSLSIDYAIDILERVVSQIIKLSDKLLEYQNEIENLWEGKPYKRNEYIRNYLIGKVFYMQRIASSHFSTIRKFLCISLLGEGSRLSLSEDFFERHKRIVDKNYIQLWCNNSKKEIDVITESLNDEEFTSLLDFVHTYGSRSISRIVDRYRTILRNYRTFDNNGSSMNFSSIYDKWQRKLRRHDDDITNEIIDR